MELSTLLCFKYLFEKKFRQFLFWKYHNLLIYKLVKACLETNKVRKTISTKIVSLVKWNHSLQFHFILALFFLYSQQTAVKVVTRKLLTEFKPPKWSVGNNFVISILGDFVQTSSKACHFKRRRWKFVISHLLARG